MIKKGVIGIITFACGIGISLYSYSFFREQIQNVFQWTTFNGIQFTGKNFYIFSTNFYYASFGIAFLIFYLANSKSNLKRVIKNGITSILIFIVLVFGISAIDANLKLAQCTVCGNGVLKLHWNGINYGLILGLSIMLSIIPSLISIFRNRIKTSTQQ